MDPDILPEDLLKDKIGGLLTASYLGYNMGKTVEETSEAPTEDHFYNLLYSEIPINPKSNSGNISTCTHSLDPMQYVGNYSIKYHSDYKKALESIHLKCPICTSYCKIFHGMLDLALHNCSKKQILNPKNYTNLKLDPAIDLESLFIPNPNYFFEGSDNMESAIRTIIYTFRQSCNIKEGLSTIVYNSICPTKVGALAGQLFGAYYGITNISEAWLQTINLDTRLKIYQELNK
jgi:hypothetical protein